ncbi:ricin-type beta-trefoil lectin domain protein [Streptomyces corynorhini]|uniref:Ricin B lectin domain-containing protein n=1 Tax=Streptomyces corynorhini TaxID=2282652 RepID=A0A370BKC3_9ACTN|nr:ricin-type beta-trefoil lectin domain protein [Streptomyces corynorhini]RDG39785.1 hypothetical protein DVH02_01735 [Streptomyces corynorhini]
MTPRRKFLVSHVTFKQLGSVVLVTTTTKGISMRASAKIAAMCASAVLTVGAAATAAPAQAAVSGFSIRNAATGKCLTAPDYNHYLDLVTCDKNHANQRWANVGFQFQNRFPALGNWCMTGQAHEQRVYLRGCSSAETNWSVASLRDNAQTPISNSTCGYLKWSNGAVACGARSSTMTWVIDY